MRKAELPEVLDYILNRASEAEFEVIRKACERRQDDLGRFARVGGMNPNGLAARMADTMNDSLAKTMDGMRRSVRSYVAQIIRREAPEISDEELAALVDMSIPADRAGNGAASGRESAAGSPGGEGLVDRDARGGRAGAAGAGELPPEALAVMAEEYLRCSLGAMTGPERQALWDEMGDWQAAYWRAFPPALKALIQGRLDGKMDDERFWAAALGALGL